MSVPRVPKIQKAMPKPFQRNSITLDFSDKREWKKVQAGCVEAGDTVVGVGKIRATVCDGSQVRVWNVLDESRILESVEEVFAFVKVS